MGFHNSKAPDTMDHFGEASFRPTPTARAVAGAGRAPPGSSGAGSLAGQVTEGDRAVLWRGAIALGGGNTGIALGGGTLDQNQGIA
jgi:hypothetical protein